jgi:hypothetical protein
VAQNQLLVGAGTREFGVLYNQAVTRCVEAKVLGRPDGLSSESPIELKVDD